MEVYHSKSDYASLLEKVLECKKGERVAIKLHVGELGNKTHLDSAIAKMAIEAVKARGAEPFLTDTTTLYGGARHTPASHLNNAEKHGFTKLGAPFIIADEKGGIECESKGILKRVELGKFFSEVDYLVVLSHCKGHFVASFGGAIKNMGMGCATKECKLAEHKTVLMKIDEGLCNGCGICAKSCNHAIIIDGKRREGPNCMHCGGCADECPQKAVKFSDFGNVQKALCSVALAVKNLYKDRWCFLSAGVNITKHCDCQSNPGAPVLPDVGYFSSKDPVAIDKAFLDLAGVEKIEKFWNKSPLFQIEEGERIGLGSAKYELVRI
ncbi:MAG: DUF362 domain-containing protein [Candidatus Micrarchaeota archaeon]|nr:DUF362 domain-containing protein [Candidatus Micrarchaeota archaeon]